MSHDLICISDLYIYKVKFTDKLPYYYSRVSLLNISIVGGRTDDDDGADYVYQNYTYVFESCGEEAKKLIIRPLDDNLVEPDETYNLTIKLVSQNPYVKIGKNGTTTITIYNDDGKYVRIRSYVCTYYANYKFM